MTSRTIRRLFAAFVAAHGIVHVLGFLPAWHLPAPEGFVHTTTVLAGRVDVGELGAAMLGVAWLVVAALLVMASVRAWRGRPGAALAVLAASAASAVLCVLAIDVAEAGLTIDAVLMSLMVVAPRLAGDARGLPLAFLR